ncbi:unnamed protein product [Microthlaspi erraticum]|uniref:HSF-type DNA-binding domain-containing protein n=1 Tax=Microthlaspi erraticum TaxID=1685480 RepID=A0A6D2LKW9_9BRAS|nr:unnamed protein product [Microthlaspi erraticum]
MWITFYPSIYEIVDDPSLDAIISWSKSNHIFIVWDPEALQREVLPNYTMQFGRDYSRFLSQIKHYGFKRIRGSAQWEFGHKYFVRGQPELLDDMLIDVETERMAKFSAKLRAKEAAAKAKAEAEHRLQRLLII